MYCALCTSHMTSTFTTQSFAHVLRLTNPPLGREGGREGGREREREMGGGGSSYE